MAKPTHPLVIGGRVEHGVLHLDSRKVFDAALRHESWQRRVVVTVAPEEQRRSLRANAYLWGVVYKLAVPLLHAAGLENISAEHLHSLMKERHNYADIIDPFTGEIRRVALDTKNLDVEKFGIFIELVMADLAELLGVSFPEPRKHEEWREKDMATV